MNYPVRAGKLRVLPGIYRTQMERKSSAGSVKGSQKGTEKGSKRGTEKGSKKGDGKDKAKGGADKKVDKEEEE